MLGIVLWFGDTWVEMRFFLLALVWPRALPCATTAIWGKWGLGGELPSEMGGGEVNLHSIPIVKGFQTS